MNSRSNLQILYAILVLMVAKAYCTQFMCYVCENCQQITNDTPKLPCDESFFAENETTSSPGTTDSSTTEITTTTLSESTSDTTITESTSSTNPPPPTAPTAGPIETTSALPTPTNVGTVAGPIDEMARFNDSLNSTEPITTTTMTTTTTTTTETTETETESFAFKADGTSQQTTLLKPLNLAMQPAELRVRQLRSVISDNVTSYHCFTTEQKVNGTTTTTRGCSRVASNKAVCTQLEQNNNNTKYDSCRACTNTLCNSSNAIGVSAVGVILGLVCAFLVGFPA